MEYLFADKNAQRVDPKYPNLNKPVRFRKPHQNMVVTRKKNSRKNIHSLRQNTFAVDNDRTIIK